MVGALTLLFLCLLSSSSASIKRVWTHKRILLSFRTASQLSSSVKVDLISWLTSNRCSSSMDSEVSTSVIDVSSAIGDNKSDPGLDSLFACFGRANAGGETVAQELPLSIGDELVELGSEADISGDNAATDLGDTGGEDEEIESRRRILLCWKCNAIYRWSITAYMCVDVS